MFLIKKIIQVSEIKKIILVQIRLKIKMNLNFIFEIINLKSMKFFNYNIIKILFKKK